MKIRQARKEHVEKRSKFTSAKDGERPDGPLSAKAQKLANEVSRVRAPNAPDEETHRKLRSRKKARAAYNRLHAPRIGRVVEHLVEVIKATGEEVELETDYGTVIVQLKEEPTDAD